MPGPEVTLSHTMSKKSEVDDVGPRSGARVIYGQAVRPDLECQHYDAAVARAAAAAHALDGADGVRRVGPEGVVLASSSHGGFMPATAQGGWARNVVGGLCSPRHRRAVLETL